MTNEYQEELKVLLRERMMHDQCTNSVVKYLCSVYVDELEKEYPHDCLEFLMTKHLDKLMLTLFRAHFSIQDSTMKLLLEAEQKRVVSYEVKCSDSDGIRFIEQLHRDSDSKA